MTRRDKFLFFNFYINIDCCETFQLHVLGLNVKCDLLSTCLWQNSAFDRKPCALFTLVRLSWEFLHLRFFGYLLKNPYTTQRSYRRKRLDQRCTIFPLLPAALRSFCINYGRLLVKEIFALFLFCFHTLSLASFHTTNYLAVFLLSIFVSRQKRVFINARPLQFIYKLYFNGRKNVVHSLD